MLAAVFPPNTKHGPYHGIECASHHVPLQRPPSNCECPASAALLLHPCCPLSTAPEPQGPPLTSGITITSHHKPLSPFAAVLAPVPRNPHSGSEAPRGPYPGTGHRNRTIFSPGQAEALEKGAGAGAEVLSVTHGGIVPKACGQRLRGGGYGWPCVRELDGLVV